MIILLLVRKLWLLQWMTWSWTMLQLWLQVGVNVSRCLKGPHQSFVENLPMQVDPPSSEQRSTRSATRMFLTSLSLTNSQPSTSMSAVTRLSRTALLKKSKQNQQRIAYVSIPSLHAFINNTGGVYLLWLYLAI